MELKTIKKSQNLHEKAFSSKRREGFCCFVLIQNGRRDVSCNRTSNRMIVVLVTVEKTLERFRITFTAEEK